jgi:hemerythrin superfamily protein
MANMDAITMLREDHREVEQLFKKFEKTDPSAYAKRRSIVSAFSAELTRHALAEEQAFYPAVREALPDVADTILEGLEEHHIVKVTLTELAGMDPRDERFTPKVTVLMESVRHHVEEEEGELFPEVRKAIGRTALRELAVAMEAAKRAAPATPPSPQAPDTPPRNLTPATRDVANRARRALSGTRARTGAPRTRSKSS